MDILTLKGADVKASVSMTQAIEAVKAAFAQLSSGQAIVPLRTQIPVGRNEGRTLVMPAYIEATGSLAVKVVSVFPENAKRGLPTIHALVMVVDSETGRPLALMDGESLTAIRTGAASGAATDLLSRRDAETVAIIGAGVQGKTQLQAVCEVRKISRVFVYDTSRPRAEAFAQEMGNRGKVPGDIIAVPSASEAVSWADIICTATTSHTPVFRDGDLRPGTHINGIGSYTPDMQEVDEATVVRAKIVVDSLPSCLSEAGDIIIPIKRGIFSEEKICAELGEIVLGLKEGRT
ncbi:MAG: hypothetical protein HGA78_12635, partial [Nitrospirales bacterium]|nr:hypothetical protein [Nitrospirales bacterium]